MPGKTLVTFLLLSLVFAVAARADDEALNPFPKDCGDPTVKPPPQVGNDQPNPATFTYKDLCKVLDKNPKTGKPVESIEELVPNLPAEFRKNFTFMSKSESPHQANGAVSPQNPRTIMFSDDARMVIAFTTDPKKPGFNTLEITEYQDDGSFKVRKVELPGAGSGGKPDYGKPPHQEPKSCAACHGKDARPIWESFNLWPGAYGAQADQIGGDEVETKNYEEFLKTKKNTGVFKYLDWPSGTKYPPYSDGPDNHTLAFGPNARLGMALTALNRKRLMRLMKKSPKYEGLKKYLASVLLRCETPPIDEKSVDAQLKKEQNEKLKKAGLSTTGTQGDLDASRFGLLELTKDDSVAVIKYVQDLLGPDEVDAKEWSLSGRPGSLTFFDGVYDGEDAIRYDFIYEIYKDVRATDPNFKTDDHLRDSFLVGPGLRCKGLPYGEHMNTQLAHDQSCDYLKGKACRPPATCASASAPTAKSCNPGSSGYPGSQPSIDKIDPAQITGKLPKDGLALLGRCTDCHSAPPLNFDNPKTLRAQLQANPALLGKIRAQLDSKKMPQNGTPFTKAESDLLLKSLTDLKNGK
ncbi:MAG: hypothetical protein HY075_03370 [Deltaproteobacteria bacterium]|nr:hypothetical protein [Deltaproteobacteria bacterium]